MSSIFTPTPWLKNPHLQTLWGALVRYPRPQVFEEDIALPDGDVLGIQRTGPISGRSVIMVMHGLEGSLSSPYCSYLLEMAEQQHACGVLLRARGSAQRANRLARNYHSGDWEDAQFLADYLFAAGAKQVIAIGISLGGNQLLKWLGETGDRNPLSAAISVCVPFELAASTLAFMTGFARIYQMHLMRQMRASMLAKQHLIGWNADALQRIHSVCSFDAAITAPLHGFQDVNDYYKRCSSRQYVGGITKPCFMIQAADDPFVPLYSVPTVQELSASTELMLCQHGGHVGFLSGAWPRPALPTIIQRWLRDQGLLQ